MRLSQPGVTLFTPPFSSSSFLHPTITPSPSTSTSINFSHNSSKDAQSTLPRCLSDGVSTNFPSFFSHKPPAPQLFTFGISGQCTKQLQLTRSSDDSERSYERAQNNDFQPHESSFGHEAVAGAASFGAFKLFEDHQRKEGS